MSKHDEFILTPITSILEEMVCATSGLGDGIETYPLSDYIMQSVFLKMTGFQEQKCKCIAWEIATVDYEFRRSYLNGDFKLGECSTYEAKNIIFQQLIESIEKLTELDNFIFDEKKVLLKSSKSYVKSVFKDSNLVIWAQRNFDYFCSEEKVLRATQVFPDKNGKKHLFENILIELYKKLYSQRNRIAHNTLSYQQNLPDLKVLEIESEESRNYFLWFTVLVFIDSIYIDLYKIFLDSLEENMY